MNASPFWVVKIDNRSRRKPIRDKKIVRAATKELAESTALNASIEFRNRKGWASARLACPSADLGMKTKEETFELYASVRKSTINRRK